MSRVRGTNTGPEIRVRKVAHALGLRFRLHRRGLPGKPDIVLPKRRAVIFVHGCYWHRHPGCRKATPPSSDFWKEKFEMNVARDAKVARELRRLGWRVVTIWECQTKDPTRLQRILANRFFPKAKKKRRKTLRTPQNSK